jgi:DNA polymerase III alpha subunit
MGTYFSEHPLSAMASKLAEHASVLCGQITNEMAGEKVIVAGMISTVRHASTKNNNVFVIATFEDLNGSIEVIVWSNVYTQTQDLWIEGNILIIEGTVKVREDRVSISCSRVRKYEPDANNHESNKREAYRPQAENNNHNAAPKKLVINLNQSSDTEQDRVYLQRIMEVLKRYPGKDSVQLAIRDRDRITRLDIPDIKIDYCNDLMKELNPILAY